MLREQCPPMSDEQWHAFETADEWDYLNLENVDNFDWDEFFRRYDLMSPILDQMTKITLITQHYEDSIQHKKFRYTQSTPVSG